MKTLHTPIERAIHHTAVAVRNEERARLEPETAPGLLKLARFHRTLAQAFIDDAIEEE